MWSVGCVIFDVFVILKRQCATFIAATLCNTLKGYDYLQVHIKYCVHFAGIKLRLQLHILFEVLNALQRCLGAWKWQDVATVTKYLWL